MSALALVPCGTSRHGVMQINDCKGKTHIQHAVRPVLLAQESRLECRPGLQHRQRRRDHSMDAGCSKYGGALPDRPLGGNVRCCGCSE